MRKFGRTVVVGVFEDRLEAQHALDELRRVGFDDDAIGVAARDEEVREEVTQSMGEHHDHFAERAAALGLTGGAGIGILWGIAAAANVLPAIGPVIAGGTLAAILASAALGAAAGGIAGALIGIGIPEDQARDYEEDLQAGRILIAVRADDRTEEAMKILHDHQARTAPLVHAGPGSWTI